MDSLTVSDLKRLCSERGLNPGKLRKQQIIDLLVDDGLEELPTEIVVRDTPRKSILTPSRSRRSAVAEAESGKLETPRSIRRRTKLEAAGADKENASSENRMTPVTRRKRSTRAQKVGSADGVNDEDVAEKNEATSEGSQGEEPRLGRKSTLSRRKTFKSMKSSSDEEMPVELELAEEDAPQGRRRSSRKKSNAEGSSVNISDGDAATTGDDQEGPPRKKVAGDSTDEDGSNRVTADESAQIASEATSEHLRQPSANPDADDRGISSPAIDKDAEQDDGQPPPSDEGDNCDEVDNENQYNEVINTSDGKGSPPSEERQWRTSENAESDDEHLEGPRVSSDAAKQAVTPNIAAGDTVPSRRHRKTWNLNSTAQFNFACDEQSSAESSPKSSLALEDDELAAAIPLNDHSPPVTIRENTFVVGTPSQMKANSKDKESSRTPFKATKTPNFKKLHEREQARMENIVDHQSRKRERMRKLLQTTREIRDRGSMSRLERKTPMITPLKTPMTDIKKSYVTPSSSAKKILSDKVRSNRRFDLLMKARGINIEDDVNDKEDA